MTDEVKGDSVAPESNVSDKDQESTAQTDSVGKNQVQYDTYRRAVGDAKKWKTRFDEVETKLTDLQQRELERDGKKDELIEQLRKQNTDLSTKLNSAVSNFAMTKAYDVIVDKAVNMGCTSTKLLKKIVADELETLDYDESFSPNEEQVKAMLERVKKEEPILFQKSGPRINSHIPVTQNSFESPKPDISKMTNEQIEAELMKHGSLVD